MSQINSEIIGVIEVELDSREFHHWMDDDASAIPGDAFNMRSGTVVTTSHVAVADVARLSDDLRVELARMLHRLRIVR